MARVRRPWQRNNCDSNPGVQQMLWGRAAMKSHQSANCKKMIVALARKLLIALWHLVRDGAVPEGIVLRPAH